jgi:hypothetical protein
LKGGVSESRSEMRGLMANAAYVVVTVLVFAALGVVQKLVERL